MGGGTRSSNSIIPNPHARGTAKSRSFVIRRSFLPSRHRRPSPRREKTTTMELELRCCRCHCCRQQQQQRESLLLLLAPKRLDFRCRLQLLPLTSQQRWQPRASRRRGQPAALPAYRGKRRGDSSTTSRSKKRREKKPSLFRLCFPLKRCASVRKLLVPSERSGEISEHKRGTRERVQRGEKLFPFPQQRERKESPRLLSKMKRPTSLSSL